MNFIHKLIGKRFLADALRRLQTMNKLKGYKTYIVAIVGILTVLTGLIFGNTEVAGTTIPPMELGEAVSYIWEALMVIFVRKGIAEIQ